MCMCVYVKYFPPLPFFHFLEKGTLGFKFILSQFYEHYSLSTFLPLSLSLPPYVSSSPSLISWQIVWLLFFLQKTCKQTFSNLHTCIYRTLYLACIWICLCMYIHTWVWEQLLVFLNGYEYTFWKLSLVWLLFWDLHSITITLFFMYFHLKIEVCVDIEQYHPHDMTVTKL